MPSVSPIRIAAYAAMAVVLLLVGWSSLKSGDGPAPGGPGDGGSKGVSAEATRGEAGESEGGLEVSSGPGKIVVDVSGAVRRPGVYRFEHGRRVIDAIERAGGPTGTAFAAGINRAAILADGQQVVVPERATAAAAQGGAGSSEAVDRPISLGSATREQLEEIDGIGPVTAQSIIEFRDSQGGVSSIDDLDQVSGIGPVTMEALKSRLQP